MRWTKGKPIARAPLDTPVLAAFDPTAEEREYGRKTYFRIVTRVNGPWVSYGGSESTPTSYCRGYPGRVVLDRQPDRFWSLPDGL